MSRLKLGLYQNVSGEGPEYLCRPLVDDKERLIFSGATAQIAEDAARAWYAKNFEPKPGPKKREAVATDLFS